MILGQYKQAHLNHNYGFMAIQTSTFESQLWFYGNTNKHIWITIMLLGQYKQEHFNNSGHQTRPQYTERDIHPTDKK